MCHVLEALKQSTQLEPRSTKLFAFKRFEGCIPGFCLPFVFPEIEWK